ncbi:MAG: tetratricopeptide repeat protein [Bacteroidota bacterium]
MKTMIMIVVALLFSQRLRSQIQTVPQLQTCAGAGDLECMKQLANRLADNQDAAYAPSDALYWYERAAQTQDTMANILLASFLLSTGPEELQDPPRAVEILNQYESAGIPQVYHLIGYACQFNKGVRLYKNKEEAFKFYLRSSYYAYPPALYAIGYMLFRGEGTAQNYTDAAIFFQGGYEVGNPHAAYMLGECYRNGYGIAQDMDEAWNLYQFAAKNGNPAAQEIIDAAQGFVTNLHEDWIDPQLSAEEASVIEAMKTQEPCATDLRALEGEWEGKLLIRDFSNAHTLHSIPITFESTHNRFKSTSDLAKEPMSCRMTDDRGEKMRMNLYKLTDVQGVCSVTGTVGRIRDIRKREDYLRKPWNHIYEIQWLEKDFASLSINGQKYAAIHYKTYDGLRKERGYYTTLVLRQVSSTSEWANVMDQREQEVAEAKRIQLSVSPNPVGQSQYLDITFKLFQPGRIVIQLLDIDGNILQILKNEEVPTFAPQTFQANISSAGSQFFIRAASGEQVTSELIIR